MASSFVIGHKQVSPEELEAKYASGELQSFKDAKDKTAKLELTTGSVTGFEVLSAAAAAPGFTEIGIGKPMSLEVLTVYTGDPSGKNRDLLVASGVRSVETVQAAAKMLNQMVPNAKDKAHIQPSAFDAGSPIVYYSKSVTDDTILSSFQLATDRFKQEHFDSVSNLFSRAAGLPIFLSAKTYLLAGSVVVKMIGKLAEAIFEKGPILDADLNLRFDTPNLQVAQPRSAAIYNDADRPALSALEVRPVGGMLALVDPTSGQRYQGAAPYMIVSIDGRKRDNLEGFAGSAVSAAMLTKFYGDSSPTEAVISTLGSALELYNDSEYRRNGEKKGKEIKDLVEKIEGLDPSAADFEDSYARLKKEFDDAKERYAAWNGKIQSENFKLPAVEEPKKPSA